MKVIDLLNKIANGEEVPQRFIVKSRAGSVEFRYEGEYQLYDNLQEEYIYINDEVEVIEEDKKIEKLTTSLIDIKVLTDEVDTKLDYSGDYDRLVNKINEIIDKVNKGE